MKMRQLIQVALLAVLVSTSVLANAKAPAVIVPAFTPTANTFNTIYADNFGAGNHSYSTTFLGDIATTFTANVGNSNNGAFAYSTVDGITGAGVGGRANGSKEIDHAESISATFSNGIYITNLTLGSLVSIAGPSGFNETAQITATFFGGGSASYQFTATGAITAIWTGLGSFSNVSADGGVWSINNAFGNQRVIGLSFDIPHGANPQSDFTLVSVSAVPEPETYALLLAGLGLIGCVARRRKSA